MNAIESGIITPTTQTRLNELETLSGRLEFEIAEKRADSNKFSKAQILDFFKRLELYADGPWQTKQTLIQLLIKKIYLWEDRILIIYNFSSKTNDTDFDIDIEINNIIKALDKPLSGSSNAHFGSPICSLDEQFYLFDFSLFAISAYQN